MQRTPDADWEMLRSGGFLPEGPPQADLWDVWDNTFDDLEERERKLHIVAGQPLLLRPDGSADRDVLAYLNSYSFRTLARETQMAYARDLNIHLSYLSRLGIDWRAGTKKTLEEYAGWRLFETANEKRVSGTRFAREVAALRRFYEWAADERLIDRSPVAVRVRQLHDGTTVESPAIRPKDVRRVRLNWLTPNAYAQWRRVGVDGYRADQLPDPSWRGRNEARNSALVQTLWSSGLRIREAATLLVHEVPDFPDEGDWSDAWVANATAKGPGRQYLIEYEALRAIEKYQRTSRAEAVRRAQEDGRYDCVRDMIVVPAAARQRQTDSRGPEDRLRLFVAGDAGLEPAMLWLTESGMPMPHHTWQQVFRRANERCASKDVPHRCTAHMLRHSFALHKLLVFEDLLDDEVKSYQLVQRLLGHRNVETTQDIYLEPTRNMEAKDLLNKAAGNPTTPKSIEAAYARLSEASGLIQEAFEWVFDVEATA